MPHIEVTPGYAVNQKPDQCPVLEHNLNLLKGITVNNGCLKITQKHTFVIASPSLRVILREQSDRRISLRVNSAKNLMALRTGSAWQSH